MIQVLLDAANPQTNIQEELHKKLLELTGRKALEPIYVKKIEENWMIDEVKYFELKNGEHLKGCLLNSSDIVDISSETESIHVKKEIFLLEDGELMVFSHTEKYFEETGDDVFFNTSYRQIPEDQTLTAKEFVSLIDTIDAELDNDN